MSSQRFYANPRDTLTWPNGAVGYRPGGPMDSLGPFAKVQNCPIVGTALRMTCYATNYPDTFFSVPACTRISGRHVPGFFSLEDEHGMTTGETAGCVFNVLDGARVRVPTARRGQLLKLGAVFLQHRRFTLVQDSQEIAAVCDDIRGMRAADVSGILAHVDDGEYLEVWSTGYSRPHEQESVYECRMVRATLADLRKWEEQNPARHSTNS